MGGGGLKCPLLWICPPQNHYVPPHIHNRYIISYSTSGFFHKPEDEYPIGAISNVSKAQYDTTRYRIKIKTNIIQEPPNGKKCTVQHSRFLGLKSDTHFKDTIPKIRNKYSQKRNCAASVSFSTFMFL